MTAPSHLSFDAQSESCQQALRPRLEVDLQTPACDVAPEHTAPTQTWFRLQSSSR
jgi:hypothetical protein